MKIFEIPIYSMKEKAFDEKWEKYIGKYVSRTPEYNKKDLEKGLKDIFVNQRIWLYNQIVGYLVISYRNGSIWFDEFLTLDRKIRAVSKSKHFIRDMNLCGFHFYAKNMENDELKAEIKKWISSFEKDMDRPFYLSKENFEKLLEYIDIKGIIENN